MRNLLCPPGGWYIEGFYCLAYFRGQELLESIFKRNKNSQRVSIFEKAQPTLSRKKTLITYLFKNFPILFKML
jgi:hypothetical protein